MNCTKRLMKRETEFKQICKAEAEKEVTAQYDEITHNAAYQATATVFYVLTRDFGFDAEMLANLKNALEDEYSLMDIGILGKDYNASHVCRHLKENYGVDFGESKFNKQEETSGNV